MTWIETIAYDDAEGKLRKLYERFKGPDDNVDNIMLAHSLRPHTLEGHMGLYKVVLHHPGNTIDAWFLEAMGVLTSLLNRCEYCVEHHYAGMTRLLGDGERAASIRRALEAEDWDQAFERREAAALDYVRRLTREPAALGRGDIEALKKVGWTDGEILEINQVTAYFNYGNRTVLGLGVDTAGDILGLSPSSGDDPDSWRHR
ncbi:MAG: peroxidase-related enzyme [Acidobacteriota bacterium]